jgi:hypothetical protein
VKLQDQRINYAPKGCQAPLGATNRNHTLSGTKLSTGRSES